MTFSLSSTYRNTINIPIDLPFGVKNSYSLFVSQ